MRQLRGWLLSRPPSDHELEDHRTGPGKDDFLNDFPWIGGAPGKRALAFTTLWIVLLVMLALATLLSFISLHIMLGIVLIFVTAIVGLAPTLFLVGSRI